MTDGDLSFLAGATLNALRSGMTLTELMEASARSEDPLTQQRMAAALGELFDKGHIEINTGKGR